MFNHLKSMSFYSKLYCSLLVTLFFSGLYALRSDVEDYVSTMWVGELFEYIYKACTTNSLFNFLFTLTLVSLFFIIGRKIYQSKGCVLRCIGYVFAIVYLFNNNHWVFPKVFFIDVDYEAFWIISLIALLIIDIIAIARERLSVVKDNIDTSWEDDQKGYCMDAVYCKHRETGWDNYVDDLLALMPQNRLKNESLAIGISGCWGSGKTSFLSSMQQRMSADYRVVSFNPWTCTDKGQIISQFFELMRNQTEENDESLQDAIQKYRDIVLDTDIHPSLTFLAKILPSRNKNETLESLKNKIEEAITTDGVKPFAIFIDDLDRLEGNELFEVLRLIRITANFRNVIFIVAYDRDYICNVLNESKNIKRAEEYIQKIFHLEVSLPKFEDETLFDVFMEEVVRIASLNERQATRLRQLVMQLLNVDGLLFTDFIPNFRQARRFANVFALNLKSILAHTKDFVLKDFIGIELLHFAFPDIHRTLMYKPMTLLKLNERGLSKSKLLVYEGKDNTPSGKLLRKLFYSNNETQLTSREVRSQLSYANYFCYRLPNNLISATEFDMLMMENDMDVIRDRIHAWMQNKDSFNSLYEHFRSYYMHGYKDAKIICNFICALLEFLPNLSEYGINQICSGRYWVRAGIDTKELRENIFSLIDYAINGNVIPLKKINYLLTSLITAYPEDVEPDKVALDLLDFNQLTSLAEKTLDKYIEKDGRPLISDISKKKSLFNEFLVSASYVQSYETRYNRNNEIKSNLMKDALIKHYQGADANIDVFREFISPYIIKTEDPQEEDFEAYGISSDICSIFESYTFFEKFVHGAFAPTEEIEKKLKYIRNIMSI